MSKKPFLTGNKYYKRPADMTFIEEISLGENKNILKLTYQLQILSSFSALTTGLALAIATRAAA